MVSISPSARSSDKTSGYPVQPVTHALTVDVEDYFHVAALASVISRDDWAELPSRVEHNTQRLLSIFAETGHKGTFFVLGWVAERFPNLVRDIHAAGHEIASHGYSHQLIYNQTEATFRAETRHAKALLEDQIQQPVTGYRAASYSITQRSLWALEVLAEEGFLWDSSIFPIHHDRYGIPGSPRSPYRIQTRNGAVLTEFPLTTASWLGMSVPVAGGGYFRQFPYPLFRSLFARASLGGQRPQMFYLHPWELDPDQPRFAGTPWLSRFRHYRHLAECEDRLRRLLKDFRFASVSESFAQADTGPLVTVSELGMAPRRGRATGRQPQSAG